MPAGAQGRGVSTLFTFPGQGAPALPAEEPRPAVAAAGMLPVYGGVGK